ncbi:hypothetical protein KBI23_21380 [bacterium]|mgnify:FL=1|jgi:hypothetical protein|nr:hypothetical protein [bacterium]MBP9093586.1 hypothetical protein [bacterium]MBP9811108.1 hypothetical protein [bacterium]
MSNNRKFAIVILVVWVAILIALPAWAMSDTFPTFYQEGLSKGLAGYQSVFYALKLSGAAASWIQIPLIFGNLPVALLFKYLWKRPAA